MKQILLFSALLFFSATTYAQFEIPEEVYWTGTGDGQTWDDSNNWLDAKIPKDNDYIFIDGGHPIYNGTPFVFGSLSLTGGANLFLSSDLLLTGDFMVDENSTLSISMSHLNDYSKLETQGDCYFDGRIDFYFSTYVPQIGNQYYVIDGTMQSCNAASLTSFLGTGFQVVLDAQCQNNGVLYTVTAVNYTTAKVWDGEGGDSNWNTASNWNPDGVPTETDNVIINVVPGANVNTSSSGTTKANIIMIGDNNTLTINGDLAMKSVIHNNDTGTIVWNEGEISRTNTAVQSFVFNYGNTILASSGLKEIANGFEFYNYGSMNLNQGNLNINTGRIYNFNNALFRINNDGITIGHDSGTLHEMANFGESVIVKTSGSGISTINLTAFTNYGIVSSEQGTLMISGTYSSSYGALNGSGTIILPTGHIEEGRIEPGLNYGTFGSPQGILTLGTDLTTNSYTNYNIQMDYPVPGTGYDQIIVLGNAVLDGTINVALGFMPEKNASFQMLIANNLVSCNFPAQITASFNGTPYTFNVVCQNNIVYLNGPDFMLSTENPAVQDIAIYPNPVKDVLNIASSSISIGRWQLINPFGKVVKEAKYASKAFHISLDALASGLYFFKLEDVGLQSTITKKIVVSN